MVRGNEQVAEDYRYGSQSRYVLEVVCKYLGINETSIENISMLEPYCSEFLIHAADNEGLQRGMDEELIMSLAKWCSIPVTYAGGGRNLTDLDLVKKQSGGKVDLTIGSALDIFGGDGVRFDDCIEWNKTHDPIR